MSPWGDPAPRSPVTPDAGGPVNVAVIYHSRDGTLRALATAAAEGAREAGVTVRLRRVPSDGSAAGQGKTADDHPPPVLADLLWADGIVWGTPTYYGNVSAPLKRFIDSTSGLWAEGKLADRVVTGLTSSSSLNGGQEGTLLSLYRSMYHWGAFVMSSDETSPGWEEVGGNPYGLSLRACAGEIGTDEQKAAHMAGGALAQLARRTGRLRDRPERHPGAARARPAACRTAVLFQDREPALRELAAAVAAGIREAGGTVRLRRLARPGTDRRTGAAGSVPVATPEDVTWANGLALGLDAATGPVPVPLAHFLEEMPAALPAGEHLGKTVTAFGTSANSHSGGETMLLSAYTALHHWGALIAPPGYTDATVFDAGGNPYGTLHHTRNGPGLRYALAAARYQGRRLSRLTQRIGDRGRDG